MFVPANNSVNRAVAAFAVALLGFQTAAPTAAILHEVRHVADWWDSVPAASDVLESAAIGGCEKPAEDSPGHDEHEDEGTCEICGSLAQLRVLAESSAGRVSTVQLPAGAVESREAPLLARLVTHTGDPRGPPALSA